MRVEFALLLAFAAIGACGPSGATGAAQGTLADPNVRTKLRAMALQASSANGVSSPKTMTAVFSPDHQAAEKVVSGEIVNDHAAVYVVEITGGPFTTSIGGPPGAASAAQGNALTLTVDAQSYRVMDFGIMPNAPDLTQISPDVVDLAH